MLGIVGDLLPWRQSLHLHLDGGSGFGIDLVGQTTSSRFGPLRGATTILLAVLLLAASRAAGSGTVGTSGAGIGVSIWAISLVVVTFANEALNKLTLLVFDRACRAAGVLASVGGGGRPILGQLD